MLVTSVDAHASPPLNARRVHISLDGASAHWLARDPVISHFFNALSCLIPPVERLVIRIIRPLDTSAYPAALTEDLRGLVQQEAWHSRIHTQCNRALLQCGYGAAGYMERALEKVLRWVVRVLPDKLVVALPYAFELYTASLSLAVLDHGKAWGLADSHTHPAPRHVLTWHALEELEHQDVCRELLRHAGTNRRYGALAALLMMPFLMLTVAITQALHLHSDRSLYRPRVLLRYLADLIRPAGPYMTLVRGVLRRLTQGKADFGRTGRAGVQARLQAYTLPPFEFRKPALK